MDEVNNASICTEVDDGLSVVGSVLSTFLPLFNSTHDDKPSPLVSLVLNNDKNESEVLVPLPVEITMTTTTTKSKLGVNDRLLSLVRHRDTLLKEKEIEINELQAKMQAEMNELQAKMQAKINELNVEINSLKRAAEEQVILRVDFSGEDNVEETPSEAPKIDTMKVPASSSLVAAKSDSPRESDVSPKFDLGSEYHIYADGTQDQSFQEKLDSLMNEVIHQLNANQGSFLGYSEASDLSVEQQTQVSEAYGKLVAVAKKILVKVVSKQFENIGLDLEFIEEVKTEVMEAIGNIMAIVDA